LDVRDIVELYSQDWDADLPNRERSIADLDFLAGEQWEEADRLARKADNQPTHTINRLPQFVRQVSGDIRQSEPGIRVQAKDKIGSEETADIIRGHVRNILQKSGPDQPFVTAVEGAIQSGIGHFRVNTEYSDGNPFHQDICLKPIHNPLAVVWDQNARLVTRRDAGHCFVIDAMSRRAFEDKYGMKPVDFTDQDARRAKGWFSRDEVKLAEFWEIEMATADYAMLSNGAVIRMDRQPPYWKYDELNQVFITLSGEPIFIEEIREGPCRKVYWQKISGTDVLEERREWAGQHIPIIPVVGAQVFFPDRTDRFSLIHWAIEPQRMFNYWRSVQAGIVGSALKSAIPIGISQLGEFASDIDAAIKGNKPWFPYDDSKNPNFPTRIMPPQIEPAIMNEVGLAADDMKATTGVYDAALGARSNETSGVAIRQRQSESDISTSLFGDNLKESVEHATNIIVDLIPQVYDVERSIALLHEDGSTESVDVNRVIYENGVPRIYNDLRMGGYGVAVSMGSQFATRRQEALAMLTELFRSNPQSLGGFMDLLMELVDVPKSEAFIDRARKLMPPGIAESDDSQADPAQQQVMAAQQQMQQQAQQNILAKQRAETQEAIADAEKAKAEAKEAQLDVLLKEIEAQGRLDELRALMAQLAARQSMPSM
jgi:hypothetical protein